MRILRNLWPLVLLLDFAPGCRTRTVILDRQSDWVRLGNDVRGHVYLYQAGQWVRQPKAIQLPEGWVAGPEPKDE